MNNLSSLYANQSFGTEALVADTIGRYKSYLQSKIDIEAHSNDLEKMIHLMRSNNEIDTSYNDDLRYMNQSKQNSINEKHRELIKRRNKLHNTLESLSTTQVALYTEDDITVLQNEIQNMQNQYSKIVEYTNFYKIIDKILDNLNNQYKLMSNHIEQLAHDQKEYNLRKRRAEKVLKQQIDHLPICETYDDTEFQEKELKVEDLDFLKNEVRKSLKYLENAVKNNEERKVSIAKRTKRIIKLRQEIEDFQKMKYYMITHDDPHEFQDLYDLKSNRCKNRDKIVSIHRNLKSLQKQIKIEKDRVLKSFSDKQEQIKQLTAESNERDILKVALSDIETKVKGLREKMYQVESEKYRIIRGIEVLDQERAQIRNQREENEDLVFEMKKKQSNLDSKHIILIQKAKDIERMVKELNENEAEIFKHEYVVEALERKVVEFEKLKKSGNLSQNE